MADEFDLTQRPVRVTQTGKQALKDCLEVSEYDSLATLLHVLALEGSTPSVTERILTGMTTESEDGWAPLITFAQVTASNTADRMNATAPLKYIRWEVTQIAGTAATFYIGGMGRKGV